MQRPDLSGLPEDVLAYIEELENELSQLRRDNDDAVRHAPLLEESEPPTTMNVITISKRGLGKRTPRHLYMRQRRGGMGVFDLDSPIDDPPSFLLVADEGAGIILVTNQARAFRLALSDFPPSPVRSRGHSLLERFPLRPDEHLALVFTDQGGAYLALATERGQVRRIGSQYLGKNLQPGTVLYNIKEGGAPAAACWTSGHDELLLVTRLGQGIRFNERLVPVRGCLGIRVDPNDTVVGAAATTQNGGVFLLTADGKGTVRLLSGFAANKAPGASGKAVMKTDMLVGALAVGADYDVFVVSRLGKIVRFQVAEVPAKEGVVQGVNCMNLRADECMALAGSAVG